MFMPKPNMNRGFIKAITFINHINKTFIEVLLIIIQIENNPDVLQRLNAEPNCGASVQRTTTQQ